VGGHLSWEDFSVFYIHSVSGHLSWDFSVFYITLSHLSWDFLYFIFTLSVDISHVKIFPYFLFTLGRFFWCEMLDLRCKACLRSLVQQPGRPDAYVREISQNEDQSEFSKFNTSLFLWKPVGPKI
jgi:hypothetical protein